MRTFRTFFPSTRFLPTQENHQCLLTCAFASYASRRGSPAVGVHITVLHGAETDDAARESSRFTCFPRLEGAFRIAKLHALLNCDFLNRGALASRVVLFAATRIPILRAYRALSGDPDAMTRHEERAASPLAGVAHLLALVPDRRVREDVTDALRCRQW